MTRLPSTQPPGLKLSVSISRTSTGLKAPEDRDLRRPPLWLGAQDPTARRTAPAVPPFLLHLRGSSTVLTKPFSKLPSSPVQQLTRTPW